MEAGMEQKQGWFVKFSGWTFRFCMVVIFSVVMLGQGMEYAYKAPFDWSNQLYAVVGLCGAVVFWLLSRVLSGHVKKKSRRYLWMGLLSLAVGCLVFYAAGHYAFTPTLDPGSVCDNALILADNNPDEINHMYFSVYPNNILLGWLLAMSFRFGRLIGIKASQVYFVGLAVQSLGFALASFLAYVCSDKLVGKKHPEIPLFTWFLMLVMVCMSPWVVVMYSDSATLIIVMIEVWLYLQAREKGRFMPLWTGLLAFTAVFAWYIKPQGVIIVIAAALVTLFTAARRIFTRENLKRTGIVLASIVLGAGVGIGGFRLVVNTSGLRIDPEVSFGPAHFFMMGLNTESNGAFSDDDVSFSAAIKTYDERSRKDMEVALRRIGDLGFGGLMNLYARKLMSSYGDGAFTWEREFSYAYDSYYFPIGFRWGLEHIPNFYISAEYEDWVDWSCSNIFRSIEQCAWMAVLFLGLFAFSKRTDAGGAALLLALVGMMLFQLLFECKARYEFCFLPVHIIAAGLGAAHIRELPEKISGKIRAAKG